MTEHVKEVLEALGSQLYHEQRHCEGPWNGHGSEESQSAAFELLRGLTRTYHGQKVVLTWQQGNLPQR